MTLSELTYTEGKYNLEEDLKKGRFLGIPMSDDTATIVLNNGDNPSSVYGDTPLDKSAKLHSQSGQDVPEKIREMMRLYDYGDGSFRQKCLNFYNQGMFMQDYTDDQPWEGNFKHYFPTYHDLNIKQLRGYFTWRTEARKGNFLPTPTSFAYLYLYELLNGIGTASVEESLWKMQEFETDYLDEYFADIRMEENLRRWMLELAIIHRLPQKKVDDYANPRLTDRDHHIAVLRAPDNRTDKEVFLALSRFATGNLEASPVIIQKKEVGMHLFAEIWRHTLAHYHENGIDFMTACFGPWKPLPWYPLANAVYLERRELQDFEYPLNECRIYLHQGGKWMVKKYEELYFDKKRINALLHEADRKLRLYLNLKRPLRERADDAWATPYVDAVIETDRQARLEAAKPKVHIHLDRLDHIREEAVVTRESLLTDEDLAADEPQEPSINTTTKKQANISESTIYLETSPLLAKLDSLHAQILQILIADGNADELIRSHHLMPSVVADTLNEAFFEEVGDSILDCDGDHIELVEDYIEDVRTIIGAASSGEAKFPSS